MLISRFAAGFKNFVPVIAGASKMRVWIFELYTLIGAIIYTTLMVSLGWIFAENFDRALAIARGLTWFGFVVLVAMLAFLIWGRRQYIARKVDRLVSESEAEEAGEADEDRQGATARPGGRSHEAAFSGRLRSRRLRPGM